MQPTAAAMQQIFCRHNVAVKHAIGRLLVRGGLAFLCLLSFIVLFHGIRNNGMIPCAMHHAGRYSNEPVVPRLKKKTKQIELLVGTKENPCGFCARLPPLVVNQTTNSQIWEGRYCTNTTSSTYDSFHVLYFQDFCFCFWEERHKKKEKDAILHFFIKKK